MKKVGGLGASLEFGDEPKPRQLPAQPELRLDSLVGRLATTAGKRVLLMLDEIQALSALPNGDSIVATLRAVLLRKSWVIKHFHEVPARLHHVNHRLRPIEALFDQRHIDAVFPVLNPNKR